MIFFFQSLTKSCKANVISIDTPAKTICSVESGMSGLMLSDATIKKFGGNSSEKFSLSLSVTIESVKNKSAKLEDSKPPPTKRSKLFTPKVLDEEKEKQVYECDKCPNPRKFTRKDYYLIHLSNVHDD